MEDVRREPPLGIHRLPFVDLGALLRSVLDLEFGPHREQPPFGALSHVVDKSDEGVEEDHDDDVASPRGPAREDRDADGDEPSDREQDGEDPLHVQGEEGDRRSRDGVVHGTVTIE